LLDNEVIDLHVDSFIWKRLIGYDLCQWHDAGPLSARWFGQSDLPRLRAAGVTGANWVITTNPWRRKRSRLRALVANYTSLCQELTRPEAQAQVVGGYAEYSAARANGKHAAFIAVQGGNAFSDPESVKAFPFERLLRVTLLHLTDSDLGHTSSPLGRPSSAGLLPRGRQLVSELEQHGVLIDLAHASKTTFWDCVATHDHQRPLLVSHTGFSAVTPHWRNLDDDQAEAIADSGGLIGVLYHGPFLGDGPWGGTVRSAARHIAHGVRRFGAEHISLGSDWDGLIATPLDMPTCLELPRLVQALLDLELSETTIAGVLGANFLGLLSRIRP
jgi:membrane dipeptidase